MIADALHLMAYCDQYRRIANAHFELFCRINARECEEENSHVLTAEMEEYRRTRAELENHVAQCPDCRQEHPPIPVFADADGPGDEVSAAAALAPEVSPNRNADRQKPCSTRPPR